MCEADEDEITNRKARQHLLNLLAAGMGDRAHDQTWDDLSNVNIVGQGYIDRNGRANFVDRIQIKSAASRRIAANHPKCPLNIQQFNLDGPLKRKYRKTKDGEQFWLFSADVDNLQIICFAATNKLQLLVDYGQTCQIDGTWKVVPKIINGRKGQLVTIHCSKQGICIPCVYAFPGVYTTTMGGVDFVAGIHSCMPAERRKPLILMVES